jgi:hypothetical protein
MGRTIFKCCAMAMALWAAAEAPAARVVFTATPEPPPADGPFANPTVTMDHVGQTSTLYVWARASTPRARTPLVIVGLNVRADAPGIRALSFPIENPAAQNPIEPEDVRTRWSTINGATLNAPDGPLVSNSLALYQWTLPYAPYDPILNSEFHLYAKLSFVLATPASRTIALFLQVGSAGIFEEDAIHGDPGSVNAVVFGQNAEGTNGDVPIPNDSAGTESPIPDAFIVVVPEPTVWLTVGARWLAFRRRRASLK